MTWNDWFWILAALVATAAFAFLCRWSESVYP